MSVSPWLGSRPRALSLKFESANETEEEPAMPTEPNLSETEAEQPKEPKQSRTPGTWKLAIMAVLSILIGTSYTLLAKPVFVAHLEHGMMPVHVPTNSSLSLEFPAKGEEQMVMFGIAGEGSVVACPSAMEVELEVGQRI